MTEFFRKGTEPGHVVLLGEDGRNVSISFKASKSGTFRRLLVDDGFSPITARPSRVLLVPSPSFDIGVIAAAILAWAESPVDDVDAFLELNRRRLPSWWNGLVAMYQDWFTPEAMNLSAPVLMEQAGFEVMPGEIDLKREKGEMFRVNLRMRELRQIEQRLRRRRYGTESSKAQDIFIGTPCEEVLAIVIGIAAPIMSKVIDDDKIFSFIDENRKLLFGWHLLLGQNLNAYLTEAEEKPGELEGVG